jgi:hypothetical protein
MAETQPPADGEREMLIRRVADRLTVVCGFGELLRDGAYGEVNPEQIRVLTTLVGAARESGTLFQQLLNGKSRRSSPSKPDSGP